MIHSGNNNATDHAGALEGGALLLAARCSLLATWQATQHRIVSQADHWPYRTLQDLASLPPPATSALKGGGRCPSQFASVGKQLLASSWPEAALA
eukprot:9605403-Alexandrium_andersonii.AAC.1